MLKSDETCYDEAHPFHLLYDERLPDITFGLQRDPRGGYVASVSEPVVDPSTMWFPSIAAAWKWLADAADVVVNDS